MLKKIVVIGPESTGKSTLCKQLAQHFNTLWCPEYAREYLLKNGSKYTYDDLLTIGKGQIALEEEYVERTRGKRQEERGSDIASLRQKEKDNFEKDLKLQTSNFKPLFIDTDMYVMKVWCEFVFGKCHQFILNEIASRKYDLYLLCNIDLPWVKDELREYPDLETREKLYRIYKDILVNQSTPWIDVHGGYEQRLQIAVDAVEKLLSTQ